MLKEKSGYNIISKKPSVVLVESRNISNRIDPKYFKYDYLKYSFINFPNKKLLKDCLNFFETGINNYKKEDIKVKKLKTGNIQSNMINYDELIEASIPTSQKNKILKQADILLTTYGTGSIGKVAYVYKDTNIVPDYTIAIMRTKSFIDSGYLMGFLMSLYGQKQIFRRVMGTTGITFVLKSQLQDVSIPIPSKNIQKYIGDKIRKAENLREEAKNLRESAEKKLYKLLKINKYQFTPKKIYKVSGKRLEPYLRANYYRPKYLSFYDYLSEIKYKSLNLNDILIEDPQKSNSPKKEKRVEDGIPSLIVSDIDPYKLELRENKISVSKKVYREREGSQLQKNDVLFTTAGPPLGESTIVIKEMLPLLHGSHVTVFRCNDLCNPGYLTLVLNSIIGKIQTNRHCYGIRQQYLFNKQLFKFKIPLLPKKTQNELGNKIITSIKKDLKSKRLIKEAKQDVEDLIEGKFEFN